MNLADKQNLRGEVIVTSKDILTGKVEVLVEDKNLIVLNGRNFIANSLIAGVCPIINTLAFGTGGTVSGSTSQVIAIQPTQTTLIAPIPNLIMGTDFIFTIDNSAINTISASVSPKIVYTVLVPETSALNGLGINEMALMFNTSPATAFSIKNFSTITKSTSIAVSIAWTIYF